MYPPPSWRGVVLFNRMKTKILIITLIVTIIVSSLVIPVTADTINETTFTQNIVSTNTSRFRYKTGLPYSASSLTGFNNLGYSALQQASTAVPSGPQTIDYSFTATGNFGAVVYIASGNLAGTDGTHTYKTGDTCFIKSGYIAVSCDTAGIYGYRLTLRKYIASAGTDPDVRWGAVVATTQQVRLNGDGIVAHDQLTLTFNQEVTTEYLVLCLEIACLNSSTTGGELVVMMENEFVVAYGVGKDPNYPIYGGASGKDEFNNFGNAEHEVLDSQQAGIDAGKGAMSSAGAGLNTLDSEVNLLAGTALISGYLTRITGAVGLWPLVEISIALGLFASLLGLAGSIVTAKDSKSSSGSKPSRNSKSNKKGG